MVSIPQCISCNCITTEETSILYSSATSHYLTLRLPTRRARRDTLVRFDAKESNEFSRNLNESNNINLQDSDIHIFIQLLIPILIH